MKLNDLLKSLEGRELTSKDVANIMSNVTDIKAKAVETVEAKYSDYKELKSFKAAADEQAAEAAFKENWITNGGKEDANLSDYNLDNYKDEDGNVKYEELFETHPQLKAEEQPGPNPEDNRSMGNVFAAMSGASHEATEDANSDVQVY